MAPTKEEMLEQYAVNIGMTELEMVDFCRAILEDKGYVISKDDEEVLKTPEPGNHYQQFRADMAAAGFEVKEYRGRFFWKGPSVETDESRGPTKDDVVRATRVPLQFDNLGSDYVVYPKAMEDTWR